MLLTLNRTHAGIEQSLLDRAACHSRAWADAAATDRHLPDDSSASLLIPQASGLLWQTPRLGKRLIEGHCGIELRGLRHCNLQAAFHMDFRVAPLRIDLRKKRLQFLRFCKCERQEVVVNVA
jgi:hypothetical protein